MTRSKWRLLFSIFAVLAIMAIAVACGDDDDDDDTGSPGSTATQGQAGEPKTGGEITIQYLEFQSFDPHFSSFAQDIGVQGMVFRGLYSLDHDNKVQPLLAEGMPQISDDGTTYTIKVRSGLKWSDGEPLTAKDFAAGIIRTCAPDIAGQYEYILTNIVGCDDYYTSNGDPDADPPVPAKSDAEKDALLQAIGVTAKDDTTLEIKLQNPQPTFTIILGMWPTYPVPTHIVKTPNEAWPSPDKLAYNGPFKVESYAQKSQMVLVRNENYAGPHQAYLDKITLRYIEDTETANNAYRNGELQMALANTANLDVIKADPKLGKEFVTSARASTLGIQMNMEHKPLDNEKVRLALSQAIDRETLIKVVYSGAHVPTTSWVPEDVLGLPPNPFKDDIGYNLEAAKKNLADAGYPNGEGLPVFSFVIRDTPTNKAQAEFLKEAWEKIGVKIDIQVVDSPTRSKIFREETFDLYPGGWIQDYPDAENWVLGQFESTGTLNHYNCNNPEIDDLVEKARYNTNNEERLDQYKQINELISKHLCGIAVTHHEANNYLISPKLHGARENATTQDRVLAGDWAPEEWYVE